MTDIKLQVNHITLIGTWAWKHYNQDCAICLCKLEEKDYSNICVGTCLHAFHNDCLNQWLLRNNKCPICKNVWKQNK